MSTRRRSRPKGNTYTDRLYRRRPAAPRAPSIVTRLASRRLATLFVLGAELGHLAAVLVEWPAAVPRGMFHVLAAALAGLLAASVYYGHTRVELVLGLVLAVALPVAWPIGLSYHDFPMAAAALLSTMEVLLAGLFVLLLVAVAKPPPVNRNRSRARRVVKQDTAVSKGATFVRHGLHQGH
jgi:hypothetical protein